MEHRIINFQETTSSPSIDGISISITLPVIPGYPIVYGTGEMFTAHGPKAPAPAGAVNPYCHPCKAILVPMLKASGVYRVWAEPDAMLKIDPAGKGLTQAEWLAIVGNRDKATYWQVQGTRLDPISGKTVAVDTVVAVAAVPLADATPAKPWIVGDITVKSAIPTAPFVLGGYPAMKSDITATAVQGPEP